MRSIYRAVLFAIALGAMTPVVVYSQQFEFPEPDEVPEVAEGAEPPEHQQNQPPRRVYRQRRGWRNSPIVWTGAAVALAVVLPFGVYRVVSQMRYASQQANREKKPWDV